MKVKAICVCVCKFLSLNCLHFLLALRSVYLVSFTIFWHFGWALSIYPHNIFKCLFWSLFVDCLLSTSFYFCISFHILCCFSHMTCPLPGRDARDIWCNPLSGISWLSFSSPFLSPLLFFCSFCHVSFQLINLMVHSLDFLFRLRVRHFGRKWLLSSS